MTPPCVETTRAKRRCRRSGRWSIRGVPVGQQCWQHAVLRARTEGRTELYDLSRQAYRTVPVETHRPLSGPLPVGEEAIVLELRQVRTHDELYSRCVRALREQFPGRLHRLPQPIRVALDTAQSRLRRGTPA